ncbi:MAG: NAD(P)(+) transhydrogenase (Re/Si-specific) subunit beta, partial [Limnohabitans sp.]|nr:NAD(P)(+) transhydrogenase (Re/Si-specific) subunit beta [Limnohabitans sp.]
IVMKRSMASASAGGGEPLVLQKNKRMLFGDAKKMLDEVLAALPCTLQWCPDSHRI